MEWEVDAAWANARQSPMQRGTVYAAGFSLALHLSLAALVLTWPASHLRSAPSVVTTVDLLAALPPGPAPKPASKPAPKPAPVAVPKPAPPVQKKTVLPKEKAPLRTKAKKAPPPKRVRPEELKYEDAMAKLRREMGETASAPAVTRPDPQAEPRLSGGGRPGTATVSPEMARWALDAQRHVRAVYVTPPEFLNRGLIAYLEVRLSRSGDVLGTPKVVRSSGDPFWDDNAVRAVLRATPLPAPPEAGGWPFSFSSEER